LGGLNYIKAVYQVANLRVWVRFPFKPFFKFKKKGKGKGEKRKEKEGREDKGGLVG
jgi:hypothetical protein